MSQSFTTIKAQSLPQSHASSLTPNDPATMPARLPAHAAFLHANEAIIITDADNCVIDVNPAFCELTGSTLASVKGKTPRHSVSCRWTIAARPA